MNIAAISPSLFLNKPVAINELETTKESGFIQFLGQQLVDTNNKLHGADQVLEDLALGRAENLHQTMITLEQAKLSFQYLEQIRNRLMTAYQELLREQI